MIDFMHDPYPHDKVEALGMILLEVHGKNKLGNNFTVKPTINGECCISFSNALGEIHYYTGHPLKLYNLLFDNSDENIAWRLENGCI